MVDATNAGSQTSSLNLQTLRRLKFWVWFQEWTRPTELQVTLIWAGVIGFCGAVCSIAYRIATRFVHKILTGNSAPGLVESFTELPLWGRLIVPAIGGLIAGAIIHFGSRFHGQITTTDYMEAVVLGDGKISARQSLVKSLWRFSLTPPADRSGAKARWFNSPRWSRLWLAIATLDNSSTAIARRLWSSRGNCFCLQRPNFGRGVCRRDRARFHGYGNFRPARVCVCYCHAHGARLPRSGTAL